VALAIFSIFLSSFWIGFSGALMPGPLLTAVVGESSRRGVKAGPLMVAGHGILELGLLFALMFGLSSLFEIPAVRGAIAGAGAAILAWMAFSMLRGLPSLSLERELKAGSSSGEGGGLVLKGALLSVANPYWSIWWATVGMGLMLQAGARGWAGLAAFYAGHILSDLAWYSAVSLAIGRGRRLFNDAVYRWIVGVCAVALALFCVLFALYAISIFRHQAN